MKQFTLILSVILLFLWFASCEKQQQQADMPVSPQATVEDFEIPPNIVPSDALPPPTTQLKPVDALPVPPTLSLASEPATLTPSTLVATLKAGQSITEHKILHLPADVAPPKGDIIISMDLTGSMYQELANVKVNSVNIMNAVRTLIPDTYFGVVSHMDYNGSFTGCGYTNWYGGGGDYPYRLNRSLTDNAGAVQTAINSLPYGGGADGPESYTRVMYESYADPSIGWRTGSKRIMLMWLDAVPHDCNFRLDCGVIGPVSYGPDPGRDATVGTADDLNLANVLATMASNNVTMIALFSGGSGLLPLWDCYASKTGGDAILINYDGTIPDGRDVAAFVAGLIKEEVKRVDKMELKVSTPGFEGWLTSVVPPAYFKLVLDEAKDLTFDIQVTVPPGTPDGVYTFDISAIGDGVEYAKQKVTITVKNNKPPVANAGPDQTVECAGPSGTLVTLNGMGSSDPDGDPLTYFWSAPGITFSNPASPTPVAMFPLGSTTVTLTVTDLGGLSSTDQVVIKVEDTTPPTLVCSVASPMLWPANHNLVKVGLSASVSDASDSNPVIQVKVYGDEDDEEATGDGTHSPDAKDIALGTLRLRSERKGDADGRVYLIVVTATDKSGNVGFCSSTVVVPHSQSADAIANVNAQAAAAAASSTPAGSPSTPFVIGDGPIIGPKQ